MIFSALYPRVQRAKGFWPYRFKYVNLLQTEADLLIKDKCKCPVKNF